MITHEEAENALNTVLDYIALKKLELDTIGGKKCINCARAVNLSINNLDLDGRSYRILREYLKRYNGERDIYTVSMRELKRTRNCGPKTIKAIEEAFFAHEISILP
jgi:ERCC4-type nuclease